MSVQAFLTELRARDIYVWAEGDRLRCSAPVGVLTPELRDQLRERKSEVMRFLHVAESIARQPRAIVPLQGRGTRPPVFAVPGHLGDTFCYQTLVRHLGDDQPFFGLQPPGLDDHSEPIARVEELAEYFAAQIQAFRPNGPYIIAGYCAGGAVAFELARQLLDRGAAVRFLALFACIHPTSYRFLSRLVDGGPRLIIYHAKKLAQLSSFKERYQYVAEKLRWRMAVTREQETLAARDPVLAARAKVARATIAGARRYTPRWFPGRVGLFLPSREYLRYGPATQRWQSVARQSETYFGPNGCIGDNMLLEPYAPVIAELFRQCRDKSAMEAAP